jgi:CspA family cold shock protein
MEGKVKKYSPTSGYGFIKTQHNEYFVHASNVQEEDRLRNGDIVTFDPQDGERGLYALNVKKVVDC